MAKTRKPKHWLQDLVDLPDHRFKALRKKQLKKQKVMQAQEERGTLQSKKAYNAVYNRMTEIILAEQMRNKNKTTI
tara:strand:- start:2074 stop:2301 length:228 start_codon:yes stop_codon:yes gene_type:complete